MENAITRIPENDKKLGGKTQMLMLSSDADVSHHYLNLSECNIKISYIEQMNLN